MSAGALQAYSLPLAGASGICPTCARPWAFKLRPGGAHMHGQPLRCRCGTVLGRYQVRAAGMVWLQIAVDGAQMPQDGR
jgi:hypothetical protein